MSSNSHDVWTIRIAVYGAGVSTVLGAVKLWETFWKDRIRLATSYNFDGRPEAADEIVVTNLSNQTVQVSGWELAWRSKRCAHVAPIEQTPENGAGSFTIAPKSAHVLTFENQDKLRWGGEVSSARQLCLTLHFFDRRRKRLVVC